MQLELLNEQGQAASKFDAPETVFGREYNESLIHQIVVAFQANARQGTRAQKDHKKMYRAGMASIFSQLARDGRLAVVESLTVDSPKTKQLAAKFKAMNLDSVLVIADTVDENLYLASRNLPNVLIVEPRYADPLSLVHYKKVLVTKGAVDKLKEMFA
jgi:large subunit ribosomal protein L4